MSKGYTAKVILSEDNNLQIKIGSTTSKIDNRSLVDFGEGYLLVEYIGKKMTAKEKSDLLKKDDGSIKESVSKVKKDTESKESITQMTETLETKALKGKSKKESVEKVPEDKASTIE